MPPRLPARSIPDQQADGEGGEEREGRSDRLRDGGGGAGATGRGAFRWDRPAPRGDVRGGHEESGRLLGELADGPHRHEKAADSQAGLLKDREARRPERLRDPENGREAGGADRHSWLVRYVDRLGGTDGREEYHALLRERFAALRG